ncbi:MAG: RsiV family protein [Bacilli bacterium]
MKKNNKWLTIIILIILVLLCLCIILLLSYKFLNYNITENKDVNNLIVDDFKISYVEEIYSKKNNNGLVLIENKRNLPISETNNYSENKIVNYLTGISDKDWNNLKNETNEIIEQYNDTTTSMNIGVNYLFSTEKITKEFCSISYTMSGDMGGVSWSSINGYVFDVQNGDILNFSFFITTENTEEIIYNYVINDIENRDYDELYENWKDIVKNNMFEIGNWYFDKNGLVFTFEKYSLGPGAFGVIEINISYEIISQYLKV